MCQKFIGEHDSQSTFIHIPVHSGLKEIYIDVLKEPARLERNIISCSENSEAWHNSYMEAWDYVQNHNYKNINQSIRKSYNYI